MLTDVETYWDMAALTYEQDFSGTVVGQIRRQSVWKELHCLFSAGQRVLELNCGTGIDAVFLGKRNIKVVACDVSPAMIRRALERTNREQPHVVPDFHVLATEHLSELENLYLFDGAFSNFSGLNCIEDLPAVAATLGSVLRPGAPLLLCMMGRFVPLEIAWFLAHGKVRKAFSRLLEDHSNYGGPLGLTIRRPTVSQIERSMNQHFQLVRWKGMGIVVPPSYAEHLAIRFPRAIANLGRLDHHLGASRLFRHMADCVLLEFVRSPK